jgi:molecular chaperone GrpE
MRLFRRGSKKRDMAEKDSAEKDWPEELGTEEEAPKVRVNDRRRIRLGEEGEGEGGQPAEEAPNVKPSYVEELEARARESEQKVVDVQARFEQVRAELKRETDELRQRLARNADERVAREKAAFISALLPVIDNLQRAVEAAEGGGSQESLLGGLRGTLSGFENVLTQIGAEPIEALAQPFDPELHEAVDTAEVEPPLDGQVIAQYGRGYRLGPLLLRPARVQVGRAKSESESAGA